MNKLVIFNEDIKMDIDDDTEIFHYILDKDIKVLINLTKENINVKYHLSVISYKDNLCMIKVNHLKDNTRSDIACHGVNVLDKRLIFDVTGLVPQMCFNASCNEENKIINLNEGESVIKPNLLIRNYDTFSTHSAFIGPFNKDILFYLKSKGLKEKKIKELLLLDFLVSEDCPSEFLKKVKEVANG